MNETPSSPVSKVNNNELLQIIEEQKKNGMIESIIINNKAYFFSMYSSNQIEDITKFCCPESNTSVLGIETTFNLCDLWVTESCYKNTQIANCTTGNHLVFLGPLMFHFTKILTATSAILKWLAPTWMSQSTTLSKPWFLQ